MEYELRLLVGANEIVKFIEQQGNDTFGNIVNYFKDSVYLHARNLLNALTKGCDTEIGKVPASINSPIYGRVKKPLERYVFHMNQARDQRERSNITSDGRHLNEYVHPLTDEVTRCWTEWIALTSNPEDRRELQRYLDEATTSAQNDCSQLKGLLK